MTEKSKHRYFTYERFMPFIVFTFLALLILGPLLKSGYIFALDMVFGPHIKLPAEIDASYPFYLFLKLINLIIPGSLIQKILLFSIIVLSGLGAFRLTEYLLKNKDNNIILWGSYYAGILYVFNPFTYDRFMDGQFAVLLGYALLPFFLKSLFEILYNKEFSFLTSLKLATYALLISIVSIHAIGYLIFILFSSIILYVWIYRHTFKYVKLASKYLGISLLIFIILSSFWIVPTIVTDTPREQYISGFDKRYLLSFRTDGSKSVSVVGNVLTLNGYWGDREGRYTLVRDAMPVWPFLFALILFLALFGIYKTQKDFRTRVLVLSAILGIVLSVGIAASPFSYLNEALVQHIPFFKGFREPQKFVTILALAYAVLGGIGFAHLKDLEQIKKLNVNVKYIFGLLILSIPLLYTPTMLFGFGGQLKASNYPSEWYVANEYLKTNYKGKVLFLPWHQYMDLSFAGRVVANPANKFFDVPVIQGDNSGIGLLKQQTINPNIKFIESEILNNPDKKNIADVLKRNGVEYVLLALEADYKKYEFLDSQRNLKIMQQNDALKLYRVNDYGK